MTRYKPPHMTVKTGWEGETAPLFQKINVQLTPPPEPIPITTQTPGGNLTSTYDPAPLIGEIINFFAWLLCPPITVLTEYMETYGYRKREAKRVLAELYCERMQMCISTACNYAIGEIQTRLQDALADLYDEAVNHTFAVRNDQAFRVEPIEGFMKSSLRKHSKRQRQVLNLPTRGGKRNFYHNWTDEDCIKLAKLYAQLKPDWKSTKAIYKKGSPEDKANLETELMFLPPVLVEKLADDDPYISSPSNLALEQAALAIGLKLGQYSLRQLRHYAQRGRDLMNTKNFWNVKVWI